MDTNDLVLTRAGYDEINKEYYALLTGRRPLVIERIKEARELGDLSENFDYQDAKREQATIEGRLAELKYIIDNAEIIEASNDGTVQLGSTVVVKYIDDGDDEETILIVGQAESDPSEGKISCTSPMGESLMNKKSGDIAEFDAPFGMMRCEIVSVS